MPDSEPELEPDSSVEYDLSSKLFTFLQGSGSDIKPDDGGETWLGNLSGNRADVSAVA